MCDCNLKVFKISSDIIYCILYSFVFIQNARMQQPLAHLYFLTVLEHLMSKHYQMSNLLTLATNISSLCTSPPTSDQDRVILWIELQALIQLIAKELAVFLATENCLEISTNLDSLNSILTPEHHSKYGGEVIREMVFFHLFKQCDSIGMFQAKCAKLHEVIPEDLKCLQPFNSESQASIYTNMLQSGHQTLNRYYLQSSI